MKINNLPIFFAALSFFCLLPIASSGVAAENGTVIHRAELVQHNLTVEIDPVAGNIEVSDTITVPKSRWDGLAKSGFLLNSGLQVVSFKGVATVAEPTQEPCGAGVCNRYLLELESGAYLPGQFTVLYKCVVTGKANMPTPSKSPAVVQQPITADGVLLGGSMVWYPIFADSDFLHFNMTVGLPPKWRSVSQGVKQKVAPFVQQASELSWSGWKTLQPTDEVTLVAGPWFEYAETMADQTKLYVFFSREDPALAKLYLDASAKYIKLYSGLLGTYPYKKFAVVENYQQTGWGMPSFTLLGSRILRLPFILHSSLPHEILHNWFGNGVFVDYQSGNWSEGLTAYLADYLMQEQQHGGAAYRRNALLGYSDFVGKANDFPLVEFRSRHNSSSQAIGYGKGAFLFHQLRQTIGDEAFIAGLKHFFKNKQFLHASYSDLQTSMSIASGQELDEFFKQWSQRIGAPTIKLKNVQSQSLDNGEYKVSFTLQQTANKAPYTLQVPIAITGVGESRPTLFWRPMDKLQQDYAIITKARPMRLDVDSSFDIFRTLYPEERPITLSRAFGAKRGLLIYPATASKPELQQYRDVATAWNLGMVPDDALSRLPTRRAVWIFGKDNRFGPNLLKSLYRYEVGEGVKTKRIQVLGEWYNDTKQAIVLVGNNPADPESALVQIMARPDKYPNLLPALTRKLPHYGRYSYLVFNATDANNQLKGQWPATGSPLSATFDNQGNPQPTEQAAQTRQPTPLPIPESAVMAPTATTSTHSTQQPQPAEGDKLIKEALKPKAIIPPTLFKKRDDSIMPEPVLVPLSTL